MENYIVSARKYRPQTFDEVVGQEVITNTLKTAIKTNRVAHAFLFCGPRGVGKTTCARILAKTVNCENLSKNLEPCNKCASCVSFNTSASFNIHELDAASNNSVDDIRSLIDQVRIIPQIGRFSVYIIDEVHMLSQSAFNAFLKTLEEPPLHAIFILATTERHKIIPTILSRCQIFNFKRIQIKDAVRYLKYVAKSENVEADEDALHIIAQKSDGSLRDCLSIFDQLVNVGGNKITYKQVIENFNILDYDYYFKATDITLKGNVSALLLLFNEILNNGFDGQDFINGLSAHFRDILVCKDISTLQLLEVSENIKEKYTAQSQICSEKFLFSALEILNQCDINYKESKNQRLLVELGLIQLCSIKFESEKEKVKIIFQAPSDKVGIASTPTTDRIGEKSAESITMVKEPDMPTIAEQKEKILTKGTGISIKEQLSKLHDEEKKDSTEGQQDDIHIRQPAFQQTANVVSFDGLQQAWQKYAQRMKEAGKEDFYRSLIYEKNPHLQEEHKIIYYVFNASQREYFIEKEKTDMLKFLRENLNNYLIDIEPVIKKIQETKRIFTPQDKFKKMAEKNPNIIKLKEQLGMELE